MDLGSLNLDGIENIINSMSQQDIEKLSSMAGEFFGGNSNSDKHQSSAPEGIDFDTVTKIASVINRLSSMPKDPGCELLTALKPLLSPERRHKADEAIKMMQIIAILPMLKDLQ